MLQEHESITARNSEATKGRIDPGQRRRRTYILMALFALVVGGVAFFAARRHFFPRYWSADDMGPAQVSAALPPGPAPEGMVWIPGGVFWMGSEEFVHAQPVHKVYVDGFWMDKTEVTNEQFARFVLATGYVTLLEGWPDPEKFKDFHPDDFGFQPDYLACVAQASGIGFPGCLSWAGLSSTQPLLKPCSLLFNPQPRLLDSRRSNSTNGWRVVAWTNWKHPEGPGSDLKGREKHPVVHICYDDALAYCRWAGKRLPTEAQWEFASRGGLDRKKFLWGDELNPDGKWMANIWQGDFPRTNTREDGYAGAAPVGSFPANGFGLSDMSGNVWEWCADWYQPYYTAHFDQRNPQGPASGDPRNPERVQRGGSFLCSDSFCKNYMAGGRTGGDPESGASHVGFRCARTPAK